MNRLDARQQPLHTLVSILMGLGLAIASIGVCMNAQADTRSADEAAWLQHLKVAHTKQGVYRNGTSDTNLVNAGWQMHPGSSNNLILTNQDLRYLMAAMGSQKKVFLKDSDLHYQAEVGDELVQLKFFYHF